MQMCEMWFQEPTVVYTVRWLYYDALGRWIKEGWDARGMYGEQEKCLRGLAGKPEIKGPFVRSRSKCEGNNKFDL
jgi:hypothetical protein